MTKDVLVGGELKVDTTGSFNFDCAGDILGKLTCSAGTRSGRPRSHIRGHRGRETDSAKDCTDNGDHRSHGRNNAVTKAYVDSVLVAGGFTEAARVVLITKYLGNGVAPANLLGTIDGVTVVAGDRVLLVGQHIGNAADEKYNGVWVAVAGGAWTRRRTLRWVHRPQGNRFLVTDGTAYGSTTWSCTSPSANDTVGTDLLSYVQIADATTFTNGDGLDLNGTVFSVSATNPVAVTHTATGTALTVNEDAEIKPNLKVGNELWLSDDQGTPAYIKLDAPATVTGYTLTFPPAAPSVEEAWPFTAPGVTRASCQHNDRWYHPEAKRRYCGHKRVHVGNTAEADDTLVLKSTHIYKKEPRTWVELRHGHSAGHKRCS